MTLRAALVALAATCVLAGAPAGAPAVARLAVTQSPVVRSLLMPLDRVEIGYVIDTAGVESPIGSLYVRTDLEARFERLPLALTPRKGGRAPRLHAVVPNRLLRGEKLLYYAVVRDPKSGRSAAVPAAGARGPSVAWILRRPSVVRLGAHVFGHTRAPQAVVARAGAADVGFQTTGIPFGPQTFVVGRDRSTWLLDGLNQRLLVWAPGRPGAVARTVPLPHFSPDTDFALGPAGSVYSAWWDASAQILRLDRLTAAGSLVWESTLASDVTNAPLRIGPDGALYAVNGKPGSLGAERGWTPVTTIAGRPLSVAQQISRNGWPFQPVPGGLRLLSSVRAPYQLRVALLDRRNRIVRAWRVVSRTAIGPNNTTPALVGGDPVVVLDVTRGSGEQGTFQWEYEVLRLGRAAGTATRFSLSRAVYGDDLLADVRVGPGGSLYQLASSPDTGVTISRYPLARPDQLSSRSG